MNKDSSILAGILIFLTKIAGLRGRGMPLSCQRLNETLIFTKHGTNVTPLEDIPNSYAVVSFHEIRYDMPLVIILTSHFLISYNWWKTTCWQRHFVTQYGLRPFGNRLQLWFGLFVHPFSHVCEIGHVNYSDNCWNIMTADTKFCM